MNNQNGLPTQLQSKSTMLYNLDESMPLGRMLAYSVQHLIYFLAGAAIMPVIVGVYLGLDQAAVANMLQRTFFLCGFVSILQVTVGHRYPIIDGPGGLWMGMLIILSGSAVAFGKELSVLCTDLELGMIVAGLIVVLIGISGLMSYLARVFNPVVNGCFLILMSLQLSATVLKGATGISAGYTTFHGPSFFIFMLTTVVIVIINLFAKGFFQSIATLIGVTVGWLTAFVIGVAPPITAPGSEILSLPKLFAWGAPTFDPSVVLTCILGAVILFSNLIASINGMAEVVGDTAPPQKLKHSTIVYGLSLALDGLVPTVGFIPFASSMGVIAMTRVASRMPFILGSALMIILGLIKPVGSFFASIPAPVGYSAMMIVFALIIRQGLSEFRKVELGNREGMIIGLTLFIAMGVMFLPPEIFAELPQMLRYIVSNGLVVGILLGIMLEHVILNKRLYERFTQ